MALEQYYRMPQLCTALGVHRASVYRWIKNKTFPSGILIGPNVRVWPEADITAWLSKRMATGGDDEHTQAS